jgi:ribonuclease P protein component
MDMFAFATTLHQGKRFFTHPITLIAFSEPVETQPVVKAEFAVAKRIMKKAVHRNRAKRQMRAAYQNIARTITFSTSVHLIFFYTEKTEIPFAEIESAMLQNIHNLQFIIDN